MNGMEAILANPVAEATASALVHFLWQGLLVGLATGSVLSLLSRARASTRYAVAVGALLVMAALPVLTALQRAESPAGPLATAPAAAVPSGSSERTGAVIPTGSGGAVTVQTFGGSLLPWVFGVWLAGVALLALYHLGGWRLTRRLARQGEPVGEAVAALARDLCRRLGVGRAVALLESAAVSVPTVVGWLKPVVLVPGSALTGLSPAQLEAILAHELAHVRRHDYVVNLLQAAIETLLFYHPAVWWISAQIRRERENCCDDLAVAVCGNRLSYARALVDLEGLRTAPRLAMAASGGSLAERVQRLVGAPRRSARRSWAAGFLALALLPAGAAIQLACSRQPAMDVPTDPTAEQGHWTAFLGSDGFLTLETTPDRNPSGEGSYLIVARISQFSGLKVGPDVRFQQRVGDGTYRFRGSFDGKRGQGTFTFIRHPADQRGRWKAERDGNDIRIEMTLRKAGWGSWTSIDRYPRHQFAGLTTGPDVRFELRRDPGTFRFRGSFDGKRGRGTFTFTANPDFAELVGLPRTSDRLLELAIHDVSFDFAREMKRLWHGNLAQQVEEDRNDRHSPLRLVRGILGLDRRASLADGLMQIRVHGITPEYIRGLQAAGYPRLQPRQLVDLSIHGVQPAYVKGLSESGYRRLPPFRLVEFHTHGITPDWLRGIVDAGQAAATPDQLLRLHIHGIDGGFIRKAEAQGYRGLQPEQLIDVYIQGKVQG